MQFWSLSLTFFFPLLSACTNSMHKKFCSNKNEWCNFLSYGCESLPLSLTSSSALHFSFPLLGSHSRHFLRHILLSLSFSLTFALPHSPHIVLVWRDVHSCCFLVIFASQELTSSSQKSLMMILVTGCLIACFQSILMLSSVACLWVSCQKRQHEQ